MDTWREKKKERPGGKGREGKQTSREIGKSTRSGKGTNRRDDLSAVRARDVYSMMDVCVRMAHACVCRVYMALAE